MAELRWWRIEVDAAGKVLSCREAEPCDGGTESPSVIYVQAKDERQAGRRGWNEYCRLRAQRVRAERVAKGKCPWCGKKNDRSAGKRCSTCLERERDREDRHRAHARGELVELPNRAATLAAMAQDERRRIRLDVLGEVRVAWQRSKTVAQFAEWLAERIRAESPPAETLKPLASTNAEFQEAIEAAGYSHA